MQKTYSFSISLALFLFVHAGSMCQENQTDTIIYRKYGPTFSYDVFRTFLLLVPGLDTNRSGYEVTADFEIAPAYYLIAEYGRQEVAFNSQLFGYSSEGYFIRAGFNYNFLQKKIPASQYEMFYGGLRYCFSSFSHSARNITLRDNFFGVPEPISIDPVNLQAHWLEVTGGIRGELFRNFYIGWAFRGRLLLYQKKDEVMYPYFIPGFGAGNKKTSIGFNYYISYRIPLYKRPVKIAHE